MNTPAVLVLEDGSTFHGTAIGVTGSSVGEVVFNTSMTGYQEILSDPSYAKQMITFTSPHVGNVGWNAHDDESSAVFATGMIIKDYPIVSSSWRQEGNLKDYLQAHNIVAIADIDTRRLTRILRDKGSMNGCIQAGEVNVDDALAQAKQFPGLKGMDLAKEVTASESYSWTEATWNTKPPSSFPYHVVVYDFGVKRNILRMLLDRGCKLTVVPAQTSAADVLAMKPDGVLLSNGPGDPDPCQYAVNAIQEIVDNKIPTFGICLGFQLLALASGAKTLKMKFGHHGANHPVQDLKTKRVFITSQNHGFAVDEKSLPATATATYRSLFDSSLQGFERSDAPAFGFQGHPEASPGPQDIAPLFDQFIDLMKTAKK